MNLSRKTWASAAVVGVIVAGGVWVAAAASAGKLDQVRQSTRVLVEQQAEPTPSASIREPEDIVVSTGINPNPEEVLEYWTDERLEDAQPMPMPEVGKLELGD